MSIKDWLNKRLSTVTPINESQESPSTRRSASLNNRTESERAQADAEVGLLKPVKTVPEEHFGESAVSAFTKERVVAYFVRKDLKFTIDDDGDLFGVWDGHPFWFLFMGKEKDFFQIRGRWNRKTSHQNRILVMHTMNDWNRDRIGPKVFLREDEDGTKNSVFAEDSFDFSDGVSDLQLDYAIGYSIQRTLHFFNHLSHVLSPEGGESIIDDE